MGRFYTEYTNRRNKSYGAQILPGDGVHTRGWDAGARVTPREAGPDGTADAFDVLMTWGSHDSGTAVQIGTVYDTQNGPVWVPARMPRGRRSLGVPRRLRAIRNVRKQPRQRENSTAYELSAGPDLDPTAATSSATLPGAGATLARIDAELDRLDTTVFGPCQGG